MDEEQKEEIVEIQQEPNQTFQQKPVEKKGFNITSLILGIIGLLGIIPMGNVWVCLIGSILAIVFSCAGKNEAGRGMGIAGLVLGIIALAILVLVVIFAVGVVGAFLTEVY